MEAPPSPAAKCPHCQMLFKNEKVMFDHMEAEFRGSMDAEFRGSKWFHHIHCYECKKYFTSVDALNSHARRNHPLDQDLNCPSCNKHFVRVNELMRHLEQNECPGLGSKKLEDIREQRMQFARGLQARHLGDYDEEIEAKYMSRNSALRPKPDATVRPDPVQFETFETEDVDPAKFYLDHVKPRVQAAKRKALEASQQELEGISQALEESRRVYEDNKQAFKESKQVFEHRKQALEIGPQKLQLPDNKTTTPLSIQEWQQTIPKATGPAGSLLDDFAPGDLIDYYDTGSNGKGPASVYWNPWKNDEDLICMSSRASSRASSPRWPTPRATSPAPANIRSSSVKTIVPSRSPAPTVVGRLIGPVPTKTSQAVAPPAVKPTPVQTSKPLKALTPLKVSDSRSSGSRAPSPYQPYKLKPLRNYDHLIAKVSRSTTPSTQDSTPVISTQTYQVIIPKSSGGEVPSTQVTSTAILRRASQVVTPTKTSGALIMPIEKYSTPEPAKMSQALTPTKASGSGFTPAQKTTAHEPVKTSQAIASSKGPGALTPAEKNDMRDFAAKNDMGAFADYDEVKNAISNLTARHNPKNPNFRVQTYWNEKIGKYKCPIPQCYQSFKKPGQFEYHLGDHQKEKKVKYPCPGCKDMFNTVAALIAHTESQSIRCQFRHSKSYGHFLSQAMAGIVEVVGENGHHGTVQFGVSKEARQNLGSPSLPNYGAPPAIQAKEQTDRSRSGEFKPATAAIESRYDDAKPTTAASQSFYEEVKHVPAAIPGRAVDDRDDIAAQRKHEREAELAARAKVQIRVMAQQKAREAALKVAVTDQNNIWNQKAREREQERARQANMDQERASQAKILQERKIQQQKIQEAQWERERQAKMEHERRLEQQKAREQEEARQAEMARVRAVMRKHDPRIKQESEERKPFEPPQWVQVKREPTPVPQDDETEKLEEEERLLLKQMEEIKEKRWKLQQQTEMKAMEDARKEQQARQEQARQAEARGRDAKFNGQQREEEPQRVATKFMAPQQAAPKSNWQW